MIGISIRLALALGLHLRNEDPTAGEPRKETLIHTWWSLHSIECLVSTITGRPPVIAFEDCTVPLPDTLPGHQSDYTDFARQTARRRTEHDSPRGARSNNVSEHSGQASMQRRHFTGHIRITLLSQKALIELYSPRTASKSWEVRTLNKSLDLTPQDPPYIVFAR